MTASFGEYTLDEARRELLLRRAPVHLTPKAYELLRLLLERRPAAVSKAQIHDRIWPGTFVSDVNLATLVFEIRSAIGDDPHAPRYIRTVRGFGYAFCDAGAATPLAPPPSASTAHVRLIWGDREVALARARTSLAGRPRRRCGSTTARSRDGTRGSRSAPGSASLEDLGSRHGTLVDGMRSTSRRRCATAPGSTSARCRCCSGSSSRPTPIRGTRCRAALPGRPEPDGIVPFGFLEDPCLLEGKRGLILGIANKRSIAWGIAQAAHREGARLAVTYQGERLEENVRELAAAAAATR